MQTGFVFENQIKIEPKPLSLIERAAHERACGRAKRYREAEFELLESVDEVDRLRLFEKFGRTSTTDYCRRDLKLTETITGYLIMVARKSRTVPELKAAVESGAVPVSKAVKICSVVTPQNQAEWIARAETLPKDKLEKAVAEASPQKPKKASAKPVGTNRTRVQFEEDDEFMALLKRAQDIESQRKGCSAKIGETLKAALKGYLDKHDPVRKAERAQKKTVPTKFAAKTALPRLGRQPIPAALRHQINLRDRGQCQAHGPDGSKCRSARFTHFHHMIEVQHGGKNELQNMITVCSAHHRLLHPESWH